MFIKRACGLSGLQALFLCRKSPSFFVEKAENKPCGFGTGGGIIKLSKPHSIDEEGDIKI